MTKVSLWSSRVIGAIGLVLSTNSIALVTAFAANQNYHFEQIGKPTVSSGKETIRIKLVDAADGKTSSHAVISESKLYMGSLSQPTMTAPVTALPAKDGIYKFVIGPAMAGNWLLHLVAKVPGNPETVSGTFTIDVVK